MIRLGRALDRMQGRDIDTRYHLLIHKLKKEIHTAKVEAGYAKPHHVAVLDVEARRLREAKRRKKRLLHEKRMARKNEKRHAEEHRLYMLRRGERARKLLDADTQEKARLLEREKPWCERKHQGNRIALSLATSSAIMSAFVAMIMSLVIIEFRFPYEAMHKCGDDAPDTWITTCAQVQLVSELPFQCCQANVPLPQANVNLRLHYLGYNPSGQVQSCGVPLGADYIVYQQGAYNRTQVSHCASKTNPEECVQTRVDLDDPNSEKCTWYFGYRDGPCDRIEQHRACEALGNEVECLRNEACRPNKDPWYMEAIFDSNPETTSYGPVPLEYIGKCLNENINTSETKIASTSCGMSQMDYCGDGTGPGTAYFNDIAWQTRRMTLSVGIMCTLSPWMLFLRGIRQLEFEKFRKVGSSSNTVELVRTCIDTFVFTLFNTPLPSLPSFWNTRSLVSFIRLVF